MGAKVRRLSFIDLYDLSVIVQIPNGDILVVWKGPLQQVGNDRLLSELMRLHTLYIINIVMLRHEASLMNGHTIPTIARHREVIVGSSLNVRKGRLDEDGACN